jgi:hypothetical protein
MASGGRAAASDDWAADDSMIWRRVAERAELIGLDITGALGSFFPGRRTYLTRLIESMPRSDSISMSILAFRRIPGLFLTI